MRKRRILDISLGEAVVYFVIFAVVAAVLFAIGLGIFRTVNKVLNSREVTVTVTKTEVKKAGGDDKYLVYTKDENGDTRVFEITDSLFKWRFDSSDLYGEIEKNETYRFTVCGRRVRSFSIYPNIYKADKIKDTEG